MLKGISPLISPELRTDKKCVCRSNDWRNCQVRKHHFEKGSNGMIKLQITNIKFQITRSQ